MTMQQSQATNQLMNQQDFEEIIINFCPIWNTDEITSMQEIMVAQSGFRHDSELSLVDTDFREFVDEKLYIDPVNVPASVLRSDFAQPRSFGKSHPNTRRRRAAQQSPFDRPGESNNSFATDWWATETIPASAGDAKREFARPLRHKVRGGYGLPKRSPSTELGEPPSPTPRKRKRAAQPHTKEKKRKRQCYPNGQTICCMKGCTLSVTNRLRFSLRCATESDFKADFIAKGWDRVCAKDYFSDLYRMKKMQRDEAAGGKKRTGTQLKKSSHLKPLKKSAAQLKKQQILSKPKPFIAKA